MLVLVVVLLLLLLLLLLLERSCQILLRNALNVVLLRIALELRSKLLLVKQLGLERARLHKLHHR